MVASEITFAPERALESVLYIASHVANPTIHEVLKLCYFADKLHLAKYGWLASGDDYVAMKFGPVGSGTYNLLRAARGDQSGWIHPLFSELARDALAIGEGGRSVVVLREPDRSKLSEAELLCLDEALREYGNMSFPQRTELSHDAAWREAWDAAAEDEVGQSPMPVEAIARTLPNAAEVLEHLRS
jgi:uncharacterized phage-associated protein